MAELTKYERAAIERINALNDPDRLRTMATNARANGSVSVERAAFQRLCEVQPAAKSGTVEHDVWCSIYALEELIRAERGKTIRLSHTRQKIAKDGEAKTVADLTLKATASEGFHLLIKMGHPELLFEAVVLRHPLVFDQTVRDAAVDRLAGAGVDIAVVSRAVGGLKRG
jgi:hypothetical protein